MFTNIFTVSDRKKTSFDCSCTAKGMKGNQCYSNIILIYRYMGFNNESSTIQTSNFHPQ